VTNLSAPPLPVRSDRSAATQLAPSNMAALLMRRLAGTYRGRAPLAAATAAAAAGGAAFYYASSPHTVVRELPAPSPPFYPSLFPSPFLVVASRWGKARFLFASASPCRVIAGAHGGDGGGGRC
jgi:hypothetical protein